MYGLPRDVAKGARWGGAPCTGSEDAKEPRLFCSWRRVWGKRPQRALRGKWAANLQGVLQAPEGVARGPLSTSRRLAGVATAPDTASSLRQDHLISVLVKGLLVRPCDSFPSSLYRCHPLTSTADLWHRFDLSSRYPYSPLFCVTSAQQSVEAHRLTLP